MGLLEGAKVGSQVLTLVLDASGKVGTEGALLLVDQDCAAAGGSLSINREIAVDTRSLELVGQSLANFIVADAAEECALSGMAILEHVVGRTD